MRKPAQLCLSTLQTVAVAVKVPSAVGEGETGKVKGTSSFQMGAYMIKGWISPSREFSTCVWTNIADPTLLHGNPRLHSGTAFEYHTVGPGFESRVFRRHSDDTFQAELHFPVTFTWAFRGVCL